MRCLRILAAALVSPFLAAAQQPAIVVHADQVTHRITRYLTGACLEDVNHEVYGGIDSQMIFGESFAEPAADQVSGMWRPIRVGNARGSFSIVSHDAFSGHQSQQITFTDGSGALGIENQGLNRWGMNFVRGQPYEGYLYVRSAEPVDFSVSLESATGDQILAEKKLHSSGDHWQRLDFTLTPAVAQTDGRFAIKLEQPGALAVSYAFLQPGEWGRFKGLPVRKDVAEGLISQGVTAMRYGGCMANATEYRWKKMIGPRAQRPPYQGWWHPASSDGWGIFDFLNFCEAANILPVPDLNCNETPADLADFVEYVNGSIDTPWGRRRAADGHPQPYHLTHLEIGNEERVDDSYWEKFRQIAEAIWARDPEIILVVGDFSYHQRIDDPFHFTGADGHITSLAAQQKILQLAKAHDREVWFDVHMGTEGPRPEFGGTFSYIDALDKLADGAKHRVVIFEYNAGNHSQRRALANASATIRIERDGRLPFVSSANCLQCDGQNDNDWDQGLLFLNPSQVWLQPPGYVTQMLSRHYEPLVVASEIQNTADDSLDVCATKSEDGKSLVLQLVNASAHPVTLPLRISGFTPAHSTAHVETLAADLNAANTAANPNSVRPVSTDWPHALHHGESTITLPANSFSIIRFR